VAERFVNAMRTGNKDELARVLSDDVGFWGDGGGRVIAAKRAVMGKESVVNLLLGIRRTAPSAGIALEDVSIEVVEVNNEPAMVARVGGQLDSIYVCSIEGGEIAGIRVVRNPDKLAYISRQLSGIAPHSGGR
jgi:RNA polymerase sigma-70 factor (ECF subfamily)